MRPIVAMLQLKKYPKLLHNFTSKSKPTKTILKYLLIYVLFTIFLGYDIQFIEKQYKLFEKLKVFNFFNVLCFFSQNFKGDYKAI